MYQFKVKCALVTMIDSLIALYFTFGENTRIFYLSPMIKFANSKFIFAMTGPTLAQEGEEIQN